MTNISRYVSTYRYVDVVPKTCALLSVHVCTYGSMINSVEKLAGQKDRGGEINTWKEVAAGAKERK